MLSPAMVLMVTTGTVVSTRRSCVVDVLLPAASLTEALSVTLPSASAPACAAGTFTDQLPFASTLAV